MNSIPNINTDVSITINDNNEYYLSKSSDHKDLPAGELGFVKFQSGPVGDQGVNGCQNEDLLEIVLHRLRKFQSGEFPCRENAIAITKVEEALHRLNDRTRDRIQRGVEGTYEK